MREDRIGIKVNGMLGVVEAIAAGLGVGLVPCFTAETRDDLVRISPPIPEAASTLWLLTHPDLRGRRASAASLTIWRRSLRG